MGASYLSKPLEGAMTTKLADECYLKENSPLEKMINEIVGKPDEGRLSVFDYIDGIPNYLVLYTANNGNVLMTLEYRNFGVSDTCEIFIDVIYAQTADIARTIIRTGKRDPSIVARGGLEITVNDDVEKINYWTQQTKNEKREGLGRDIAAAYEFLREKCFSESVKMKANADQYVRNLAMDGILDAAECTDN